jgi:hypothetical protein
MAYCATKQENHFIVRELKIKSVKQCPIFCAIKMSADGWLTRETNFEVNKTACQLIFFRLALFQYKYKSDMGYA